MKTTIALLVLIASQSFAAPPPIKDFPVSSYKEDGPQMKLVFRDVRNNFNEATYRIPTEYDRVQNGERPSTRRGMSFTGGKQPEKQEVPATIVVPPIKLAEFVERLKAGEFFYARQGVVDVMCDDCNGRGRIAPKIGKRDQDGKIACEKCLGKGKQAFPQYIKVCWTSGKTASHPPL
jgi:hypothetical protein